MQKSQKVIECAKKYIIENYQNADLSEEMVSKAAGVSPISFSCLFKKVTGQTYVSYLKKIRMDAAAEMLLETKKKACDIAEETGFEDCNYFSFSFKKYYKMSPIQYREKNCSQRMIG